MKRTEDFLIEYIDNLFSSALIGDDCALIDNRIITKDIFIMGTHFPEKLPFYYAGWRSFAGALSDIAAMGGKPEYFFMGIAGESGEVIKELVKGISELARIYGVELAGGDTVFSRLAVLSFTIVGKAEKPIMRRGAGPGDYVYITGELGGSRAGLELFLSGERATEKFIKPLPRIKEGIELVKKYNITSMIDISDGLLRDAERISKINGVSINLAGERIPINQDAMYYCKERDLDPVVFSVNSGEEYELLFTSPDDIKKDYVTRIGEVGEGIGINLDNKPVSPEGFEHFREEK